MDDPAARDKPPHVHRWVALIGLSGALGVAGAAAALPPSSPLSPLSSTSFDVLEARLSTAREQLRAAPPESLWAVRLAGSTARPGPTAVNGTDDPEGAWNNWPNWSNWANWANG